jgi:hypothetical protein
MAFIRVKIEFEVEKGGIVTDPAILNLDDIHRFDFDPATSKVIAILKEKDAKDKGNSLQYTLASPDRAGLQRQLESLGLLLPIPPKE